MSDMLLEAALAYAAQGRPVFPCRLDKKPYTPRGLHDATTDEKTIRVWWDRWPQASIGMPTGPASGLVAVDVDVANGKQGAASWAGLIAEHGDVVTLETRTGSGGRHLLFQCPQPPIRNTVSRIAPDIDTRGEGGYVILPPSGHPSGGRYEWVREVEPVELPAWLTPGADAPAPPPRAPRVAPDPSDLLARASAYVAAMPAAISGAGGHNAAYAVATALVHGFGLSETEARQVFEHEYNPRCQPAWSAREISHKLKQAATRPHDRPAGWLRDTDTLPEPDAVGRSAQAAILNGFAKKPEPAPQPSPAPAAFPPHLLQPPGYVGELVNWINRTAFKAQPQLALANALAFAGALLGRKVRTESDLRTNLYCLGVGASGCGKDHSRKQIKKLCADAGLTAHLLGGEDISSDSAILGAVHAHPSILFQLDEVGHFFAAANNRNAASFQRAIPVTFTKLYSSASTVYLGKEYADREANKRRDIDQPNVCLYGTTVPERLYDGITTSEIRDGFLGRMLVFYSENDDPEPRDVVREKTPADLVAAAQAWFQRQTRPEGEGNIADAVQVAPITVPTQEDAQEVFLAFRAQCRKARRTALRQGGGLDSLWSRAEENARKIALILACGIEYQSPVVAGEVAAYACDLVDFLVRGLVAAIENHVSDTEFGRLRLQVLNAIRGRGGRATKTQLTRATQGMRGRERNEVLQELVEGGFVEVVQVPTSRGPAGTAYQLKNYSSD